MAQKFNTQFSRLESRKIKSTFKCKRGYQFNKLNIYCNNISKPNRAVDNLLKLSRHQLKIVVAIFTGHAPVRGHLYIMGLFDGNPNCRFCRMETETVQNNICCCEALSRQRYNVFGRLIVEPKDISTASVRDLCLLIQGTGLLNLY